MAAPIVNIHPLSVDGIAMVDWSLCIQRDHLYNASQDAVILSGANPFSMYLKMPGSEDARTPEKFV